LQSGTSGLVKKIETVIIIGIAFCSRVGAFREAQSQMVRSLVGCVDCGYQKWSRYRYQKNTAVTQVTVLHAVTLPDAGTDKVTMTAMVTLSPMFIFDA